MDIQKRISNKQFGFDGLHPSTYLNGERWEDEYRLPKKPQSCAEMLIDRSWAKTENKQVVIDA